MAFGMIRHAIAPSSPLTGRRLNAANTRNRPFSDLTGKDFSDSSAARVRDAALNASGCKR
jgi:hypothetical protein